MHDYIDCTGHGCSRLFHLYESQGQSTAPVEPPTDPLPYPHTPSIPTTTTATVTECTNNTASTVVSQSSCNTTNIILPTTTILQEITITHITTPVWLTTWTTCQQNTTELVATTMTTGPEPPINEFCTPTISTKFIATTVLSPPQSCTSELSQFTPTPKFKSLAASLALKPCTYSNPGVPAQGTDATSALGALLGISTVLLTLVTAGLVWTCWTTRKKGGITINSKKNR